MTYTIFLNSLSKVKPSFSRYISPYKLNRLEDILPDLGDGEIHIFTDGSFNPQDQKLGASCILQTPEIEIIFLNTLDKVPGIKVDQQNAAAEILAVVRALNTLPSQSAPIHLYTDYGETIQRLGGEAPPYR